MEGAVRLITINVVQAALEDAEERLANSEAAHKAQANEGKAMAGAIADEAERVAVLCPPGFIHLPFTLRSGVSFSM